jgi:hypothetical protein
MFTFDTTIQTNILVFIQPDDAKALSQTSKGSKQMFQNVTQYCKLNELQQSELPPFLLPPAMYVNGRRIEYPKDTTYSPPRFVYVKRRVYDSKNRIEYSFAENGFIQFYRDTIYRYEPDRPAII